MLARRDRHFGAGMYREGERTMKHILFAGACALLLALALATAGSATVPGPNGLIVFRAGEPNGQIYTIRPDGTDQRQLTNLPGDTFLPHWSPRATGSSSSSTLRTPPTTTSATSP
jgi:hypothetical protein